MRVWDAVGVLKLNECALNGAALCMYVPLCGNNNILYMYNSDYFSLICNFKFDTHSSAICHHPLASCRYKSAIATRLQLL